jgi:hypothetical protein
MGFASSSSIWREPAVGDFRSVAEVGTELSPVVAFFDPHIGFASSPDAERYLEGTEVSAVAQSLPARSIVMVYQHRGQRETEAHCKRLAAATSS